MLLWPVFSQGKRHCDDTSTSHQQEKCSKPLQQSESPSPRPNQARPAPSYNPHSHTPPKRSRSYRTQPRPSPASTQPRELSPHSPAAPASAPQTSPAPL